MKLKIYLLTIFSVSMALLGVYSLIPIITSIPEDFIPEEIVIGAKPASTTTPNFTLANDTITNILTDLEAYQNNYIQTHPRYFRQNESNSILTYNNLPFTVQVSEYVDPRGNKGWETVFRSEFNTVPFYRSVGYGVESISRTKNWLKMK